MPKIVLNDISNITGNPTSAEQLINANFTAIETAIENTLSRDGTTPNALEAALDANSNRIINLPYALSNTEPVTLAQVMALVTGGDWTGGVGVPAIVFYQDAEPTATAAGQVWVKPSDMTVWIWSGTSWVRQMDPNIQGATDQANLAIAAADAAVAAAEAAAAVAAGAAADASQAILDAASAQETADQAAADVVTAQDTANTADSIADAALAAANGAIASIDLLTPRVTQVEQDAANVSLAIIELESDVGTLASTISTTSSDLGDLTSVVQSETIARIAGDEALAAAINVIQSTNAVVFIQASAPVAGVGGVPDPIPEYSFWYDSDDGNHPYRFVDGSWQSVQDEGYTTLTALIQNEESARIGADEALALDIETIQTTRNGDYALIVSNNQARIDGDAALAISIDGVQANVDGLEATVISNDLARVSGDAALASSISALQVNFNNLSATVASESVTRANQDSALASSISVVQAQANTNATNISNLSATVVNNDAARVAGDSALASSISSVNSTVGGLSTTVSQHTASINGIEGKYAVKIDNNGYVSGFGLISTNNNATPTATFTVLADNFRIVTPGSTPVTPFQVIGGTTYIKNVVIDSATIGTASIDTIKLVNQSVTDVFSASYQFNAESPSTVANVYSNLTTVYGTAAITVNGLPTSGAKVHIRAFFNAKRSGGTAENCFLRIRRDDGVILGSNPQFRLTADWLTYSWEWVDHSPVSASHTYTIQLTRNASGNTGDWEDIQVVATVLKR